MQTFVILNVDGAQYALEPSKGHCEGSWILSEFGLYVTWVDGRLGQSRDPRPEDLLRLTDIGRAVDTVRQLRNL